MTSDCNGSFAGISWFLCGKDFLMGKSIANKESLVHSEAYEDNMLAELKE